MLFTTSFDDLIDTHACGILLTTFTLHSIAMLLTLLRCDTELHFTGVHKGPYRYEVQYRV
jgi:hypothetical protein